MNKQRSRSILSGSAIALTLWASTEIFGLEMARAANTGAPVEAKLPEAMVADAIPIVADDDDSSSHDPNTPPVANRCPYFEGALHIEGIVPRGTSARPWELGTEQRELSCLISLLDEFIIRGNRGDQAYFDDNYAHIIATRYLSNSREGWIAPPGASRPAMPLRLANGAMCNRVEHFHGGVVLDPGWYCVEGLWYMNTSCDLIQPEQVESECGDDVHRGFTVNFVKSSPISFVWSGIANFDELGVPVPFSLEPGRPNAWSLWKGSAQTPLLVYDPSHLGKIHSATQLFGNWTFGGKQAAGLNVSGSEAVAKPWSNGYEALGTLDRNADGVLSGAELDALGLWFDENRDARSQTGEVRRLQDVGVDKVFYTNYREDERSGDLHLAHGFERVVDTKRTVAASVDWYSDTASDPISLVSRQSMPSSTYRNLSSAQTVPSNESHEQPAARNAKDVVLNGVWSWQFNGQPAGTSAGLLVLSAGRDGELTGFSLTPRIFQSSPSKTLSSQTLSSFVKGRLNRGTLDWSSKSEFGSANTTAELSADQKSIHGRTVVYFSQNGRGQRVEYPWTGIRIR